MPTPISSPFAQTLFSTFQIAGFRVLCVVSVLSLCNSVVKNFFTTEVTELPRSTSVFFLLHNFTIARGCNQRVSFLCVLCAFSVFSVFRFFFYHRDHGVVTEGHGVFPLPEFFGLWSSDFQLRPLSFSVACIRLCCLSYSFRVAACRYQAFLFLNLLSFW